jgi:hypothetical protein
MSMLRISGLLTEEDIEKYYEKLLDPNLEIQIPSKNTLSGWELGNELNLIQFLITWANTISNPVLVSYANGSEGAHKQFENSVIRAYYIIALLLSKEIKTKDRKESLTKIASQVCKKRISSSFSEDSLKTQRGGERVSMICPDFTNYWNHPLLYDNQTVKVSFKKLTDIILNRVTSKTLRESLPELIQKNLKIILLELFRNTHKWARHDLDSVSIKRSIRGFTIERINSTANHLEDISNESTPIGDYIRNLIAKHGKEKNLNFLEISLFDSGLGLAQHWVKRHYSEFTKIEEYNYCIDCLKKHKSSSGKSNYGIGLHEVMKSLTEAKGFFKVRTGRLSLYRDFNSEPYSYNSNKTGEPYLFDWEKRVELKQNINDKNITEKYPVVGTSYLMLIPLFEVGSNNE